MPSVGHLARKSNEADLGKIVNVRIPAPFSAIGVGAPDLGLAAWRSATILNTLTGKEPYPLPGRTAFTTFGLEPRPHIPPARRADPAVPLTPLVDVR